MKLVQYKDSDGRLCVGILAPWDLESVVPCPGYRRVLDIVKSPELPPVPENVPGIKLLKLADLELLPPVTDQDKVLCVGMNYKDHCEEQNAPIPKEPVLFSKFSSSVVGHGAPIKFNPELTKEVDYEVELAVIIGKPGKNISITTAMDHVFGYTVANDVSARDWQLGGRNAGQWFTGKSMDTFCPLGPWIATKDEIGDEEVHSLPIKCRVNGKTLQDSNTEQLIFKIGDVIAFASRFFTLLPGDVILTGTPPGVGVFRNPKIFLQDGDVVECEIEKLGVLRNPVQIEK